MVLGLIVIAVISVGVETHIDRNLIDSSGLLNTSLLGWQLIYILPVAILTNDFFISGFWMRTFASKTDKDLVIGTSLATVAVTAILGLVGAAGLLAAWTGAWPGNPAQGGDVALFLLLKQLPAWVVGIVLIMVVSLSTAAFDSFQSAMVSTGSNDLFRNRLDLVWIRLAVVVVIFPVVAVALKSPDVLQVYLISDLVSASSIPVLVIGLNDACYWWRGFEVVVGGLGGLLTVFIFGTIYYRDAHQGAYLLLLENGLYADDWSVFGESLSSIYERRREIDAKEGCRCFCGSTRWGSPLGNWRLCPPNGFSMDSCQTRRTKFYCFRPSTASKSNRVHGTPRVPAGGCSHRRARTWTTSTRRNILLII